MGLPLTRMFLQGNRTAYPHFPQTDVLKFALICQIAQHGIFLTKLYASLSNFLVPHYIALKDKIIMCWRILLYCTVTCKSLVALSASLIFLSF